MKEKVEINKYLNEVYAAPILTTNYKSIKLMIENNNNRYEIMLQELIHDFEVLKCKDMISKFNRLDADIELKGSKKVVFETISNYLISLSNEDLESIAIKLKWLSMNEMLNTSPSYQRELVWDLKRKQEYILFRLQGGEDILTFNMSNNLHEPFEVVDGQQRLNAIIEFYEGKFSINYNGQKLYINDILWPNIPIMYRRTNFTNRGKLIQYYIDLNTGGVIHSANDIDVAKSELANL